MCFRDRCRARFAQSHRSHARGRKDAPRRPYGALGASNKLGTHMVGNVVHFFYQRKEFCGRARFMPANDIFWAETPPGDVHIYAPGLRKATLGPAKPSHDTWRGTRNSFRRVGAVLRSQSAWKSQGRQLPDFDLLTPAAHTGNLGVSGASIALSLLSRALLAYLSISRKRIGIVFGG